jgi:hypothetical protein
MSEEETKKPRVIPILRNFELKKEWSSDQYTATARWSVGDFDFSHTIGPRVSALIFEICKGSIMKDSANAFDMMIEQVQKYEADTIINDTENPDESA